MSAATDASRAARTRSDQMPSVAAHPRARRSIRRAKGWGGLIGLLLVLVASMHGGVPAWDACVRALGGGLLGYVVGWTAAVYAWRHLAMAEIRAARARLAEIAGDVGTRE
jgi:hypothetical protein